MSGINDTGKLIVALTPNAYTQGVDFYTNQKVTTDVNIFKTNKVQSKTSAGNTIIVFTDEEYDGIDMTRKALEPLTKFINTLDTTDYKVQVYFNDRFTKASGKLKDPEIPQ